jgi:hypothetical protein
VVCEHGDEFTEEHGERHLYRFLVDGRAAVEQVREFCDCRNPTLDLSFARVVGIIINTEKTNARHGRSIADVVGCTECDVTTLVLQITVGCAIAACG